MNRWNLQPERRRYRRKMDESIAARRAERIAGIMLVVSLVVALVAAIAREVEL